MTDSGITPEAISTAESTAHPRPRPKSWLIVTAIYLLVLLAVWGHGAYRYHQLAKSTALDYTKLDNASKAAADAALKLKGESVARSLQMVNPDLLGEDGQKKAMTLFTDLVTNDPNLAYIALADQTGAIKATTDLTLMREDGKLANVTKIAFTNKPAGKADAEVVGPITDSEGNTIGALRVGLLYKKSK
ncbi:MAG: hypothetical protein ACYDBB_23390 [Armatimonadota bacterium]